jgi:hypothetical protein
MQYVLKMRNIGRTKNARLNFKDTKKQQESATNCLDWSTVLKRDRKKRNKREQTLKTQKKNDENRAERRKRTTNAERRKQNDEAERRRRTTKSEAAFAQDESESDENESQG